MSKIKLVVIEEHTLGFIFPESIYASVLHASVLRGSPISGSFLSANEPILLGSKKVRLASEKDFDDYRVSFKGFDNELEYEYQK